jgi:hypothetical protein
MAKATFDPGQPAISGKVGRVVYRRLGGQTVVSCKARRTKAPTSEKQAGTHNRFRAAAAYARDVLADPHRADEYARLARATRKSVMSTLVADYMKPPVVEQIDATTYHGRAGATITVRAYDDLEVVSVRLTLRDRNNAVLESGPATKDHGVWVYTTTAHAAADDTVTIEAVARDRPSHEGRATKVWFEPGAAQLP